MNQYIAVILAGGECSRFNEAVEDRAQWTPKHMAEIGGKPILFHIIDLNLETDCGEIFIIHNDLYQAKDLQKIIQYIDNRAKVKFITQKQPLGTANAMKIFFEQYQDKLDLEKKMLIFAGDMPFIAPQTINEILDKLLEYDGVFNSFLCEENYKTNKCGRLILDTKGKPKEIIESKQYQSKPEIEQLKLSMPGLFASNVKIFIELIALIQKNPILNEYSLSDLVMHSYNSQYQFTNYLCNPIESMGINNKEELKLAQDHWSNLCDTKHPNSNLQSAYSNNTQLALGGH